MLCHVAKRLQKALYNTSKSIGHNIELCLIRWSSTVSSDETAKFSLSESQWWDIRTGPLAPVHTLNTLRVPFIKEALIGNNSSSLTTPLSGFRILDVGCGGGILSEPLARLGANVTGIDPTPTAVTVATNRSKRDSMLTDRLTYLNCSIEDLLIDEDKEAEFDCVVASEVVEHVQDVETFVKNMCSLTKPGGVAVLTTINKTLLSYLFAIIGAEYITNVVPRGTHEWDKFVPPEQLEAILKEAGFGSVTKRGMLYNVLSGQWSYVDNLTVNYCISANKIH